MLTVPRLIKHFIPKSYQIKLDLKRSERQFYGKVIIVGQQLDKDRIILHSKDLTIESVLVNNQIAEHGVQKNDELIINNKQDLNNHNQIIEIDFSGKITDSMHGLYPCYFDFNGEKKELLATQFESHHAREVFPCIDEPEAKATYDLTLITETGVIVLGNMPIKHQSSLENRLHTTFNTTPIMSSYLLAFVVGDLHKKTGYTKSGTEVNVWATVAQPSSSLDFALDIAIRTTDFYNDYFDTPYPLPKCDHVALPDFSSGAMENWGLITYREVALLVEPGITSIFSRHYAALVIAHELSHQWFGNLVTMKWWNDLWLNESFATMMEYVAISAIEPDWDVWSDFDDHETIVALQRDSLKGVQPVQTEVNHPDEINTLFDGAIVYAKGARLLRMMRKYIGDDAFQKGLKDYFKAHAYKNTEANDLWLSLESVSQKNVSTMMNKWLTQPGFPVVNVEINNDIVNISQKRLTDISESDSTSLWPIPLNANYSEIPDILEEPNLSVKKVSTGTLRLNIGNSAHFVTNYSHDLLGQYIADIKSEKLGHTDRLQLLNEQSILVKAGITPSHEMIHLLQAYQNETTEQVWSIISYCIGDLKKFTENDENTENQLKQYAKGLAINQFSKLGWDIIPNESESQTKLRLYLAGLMAFSEDLKATKQAIEIYNSKPFEKLTPEIRGVELSIYIRNSSDKQLVKNLLETYKKTVFADVKLDICNGLTSVRNKELIELLLESIKDPSIIRPQDAPRWIAYLLAGKYARQQTWNWLRYNWTWIETTFANDKSFDDFPRYTAQSLTTEDHLKQYQEFFLPLRSNPMLKRNIDMGIVDITNRVNRIKRDGENVRKALLNLN